jgi:hypothetical protein
MLEAISAILNVISVPACGNYAQKWISELHNYEYLMFLLPTLLQT